MDATVKTVKLMRQIRSTTIAANCQSETTSASASSFFSLAVMTFNSRKIAASSASACRQLETLAYGTRWSGAGDEEGRKSSSPSSGTSSKLREARCSFNSISCTLVLLNKSRRVIRWPGLCIRSNHGSQSRKTFFTWNRIKV